MPRVTFVKSARKANPVAEVGESYYWWKFRFGGKHYSKTYPRQSQLTQSAYKGTLYDIIDHINEAASDFDPEGDEDCLDNLKTDIYDQLSDLLDETQESLDNMPDELQYSPTGELLQERIDALENAMSEVESLEEPDSWQDERDIRDEHESWECEYEAWKDDKPEEEEFENEEQYEAEFENWQMREPDEPQEPSLFEDWDASEMTSLVDECFV